MSHTHCPIRPVSSLSTPRSMAARPRRSRYFTRVVPQAKAGSSLAPVPEKYADAAAIADQTIASRLTVDAEAKHDDMRWYLTGSGALFLVAVSNVGGLTAGVWTVHRAQRHHPAGTSVGKRACATARHPAVDPSCMSLVPRAQDLRHCDVTQARP